MLEKTHTPAALLLGALAGVLAATLCILGSAAWMAKQGCSASMAWPLATVSVCVGGFCGSALAAFWKKEQGLLTGLLLGGLFVAALSGLLLMSGGLFDIPALLRRDHHAPCHRRLQPAQDAGQHCGYLCTQPQTLCRRPAAG